MKQVIKIRMESFEPVSYTATLVGELNGAVIVPSWKSRFSAPSSLMYNDCWDETIQPSRFFINKDDKLKTLLDTGVFEADFTQVFNDCCGAYLIERQLKKEAAHVQYVKDAESQLRVLREIKSILAIRHNTTVSILPCEDAELIATRGANPYIRANTSAKKTNVTVNVVDGTINVRKGYENARRMTKTTSAAQRIVDFIQEVEAEAAREKRILAEDEARRNRLESVFIAAGVENSSADSDYHIGYGRGNGYSTDKRTAQVAGVNTTLRASGSDKYSLSFGNLTEEQVKAVIAALKETGALAMAG